MADETHGETGSPQSGSAGTNQDGSGKADSQKEGQFITPDQLNKAMANWSKRIVIPSAEDVATKVAEMLKPKEGEPKPEPKPGKKTDDKEKQPVDPEFVAMKDQIVKLTEANDLMQSGIEAAAKREADSKVVTSVREAIGTFDLNDTEMVVGLLKGVVQTADDGTHYVDGGVDDYGNSRKISIADAAKLLLTEKPFLMKKAPPGAGTGSGDKDFLGIGGEAGKPIDVSEEAMKPEDFDKLWSKVTKGAGKIRAKADRGWGMPLSSDESGRPSSQIVGGDGKGW